MKKTSKGPSGREEMEFLNFASGFSIHEEFVNDAEECFSVSEFKELQSSARSLKMQLRIRRRFNNSRIERAKRRISAPCDI